MVVQEGIDGTKLNSDASIKMFLNWHKEQGDRVFCLATADQPAVKELIMGTFIMLLNCFPFIRWVRLLLNGIGTVYP